MVAADGSNAHSRDGASRRLHIGAAACAPFTVAGVWLGEGDHLRRVAVFVVGFICLVAVHIAAHGRPVARAGAGTLMSILFIAGAARSAAEWSAVDSVEFGPFSGEARVIGESTAVGRGQRIVLEIDGRRFETWAFGSIRNRMSALDAGEVVEVRGERVKAEGNRQRRLQSRHIVGQFELEELQSGVDSHRRSSPMMRAANRVRAVFRESSENMSDERASLFTGLVYGDDSSQSSATIAEFRASGLAHLTAVSGQNVVFLLNACSPLLSRLRRPTRLATTILVLVWFAIMTRLEPSVVRAVIMAAVSSSMVVIGRPVSTWLALCTTVCGACLIDPFLVWSVGWWLSVSGCVGLILLTTPVKLALHRFPPWFAAWAAPTIAAQTGVLGVLIAVFGWPSAVSVPCNLIAAPVAGLVMLVGMPVALVSSVLPSPLAAAAMWPLEAGVEWVASVASLGARLDPPGAVDVVVSVACAGSAFVALVRSARKSARAVQVLDGGV